MGNRAVITTKQDIENDGVGVYLHWNGGRDSVEAFLAFCKAKGYRPPEQDSYGYAYLCTTIGNFFKDGLSLGIDKLTNLDQDNFDNGVYITKDWSIVGRKYFYGAEQCAYDFYDILSDINNSQPQAMQLSKEELRKIQEPEFFYSQHSND